MLNSIPISEIVYQDIEFGQLGHNFPIGLFTPEGEKLSEYTLFPYIGMHDLSLGRLEDDNQEHFNRLNRIFCQFLPEIVSTIGGYPIKQLAELFPRTSPGRLFGQMYLADVMTLLLNIRSSGHGNNIALSGICPCPEQIKIQGGEDGAGYHDLDSIIVRTLPNLQHPPRFSVQLQDGIIDADGQLVEVVYLEPLRFYQIPEIEKADYPLDVRLLFATATPKIDASSYSSISATDVDILRDSVKMIHFGPDKEIEMDCPECGMQWSYDLEYGINYENFYCSLLCAVRSKNKVGGAEEFLNEIAFFLTAGEQSPFSSLSEVLKLTPKSRDYWIKKLGDMYKKQQEDMKRAQAQSKSKSRK